MSGTDESIPRPEAPVLADVDRVDHEAPADGAGHDVAVVGAGAVGATVAHDLSGAGATVTVYDPTPGGGSGSTARAAGVVYDAFAEDRDAAVGARSLARFRRLAADGVTPFTACPYVLLACEGDDEHCRAIASAVDRMRAHGRDVRVVLGGEASEGGGVSEGDREDESDEVGDCDDPLAALCTHDVGVAAVAADAGYLDPGAYATGVLARARERGARVVERPVGVEPGPAVVDDGARVEYDAVVVAAGAHTGPLLAAAGLPLAVKPYRVQALTAGPPFDGPMWYDATAGVYARPHPTGLLAGDGTVPEAVDPDDWSRSADGWFVSRTTRVVRHRTGRDRPLRRAWAGLCTATPDGDPLVGRVADGLYVGTGWHGHGVMRAPALGEVLARQALGGDGIDGFHPGRFDGDEAFAIREGMSLDDE